MPAAFILASTAITLIVGTLHYIHASLRMPAAPVLLILHFKYQENHKIALYVLFFFSPGRSASV